MTSCQACGVEINGRDRFCRNCGAPAATFISDSVDTHRFLPGEPTSANPAASASLTNPLYISASTAYPGAQGITPMHQTGSIVRKLCQRKLVWLGIFLLLLLFIGTGISIGRSALRARHAERIDRAEAGGRSVEDSVQNALGLTPASISDAEYPDVRGILVLNLTSDDSPAALAKIEAGDVLMELGDQPVRNSNELGQVLKALQPGSEVGIKLYRDGETVSSRIRIADQAFTPFQTKTDLRDQGFLGVGRMSGRCCIPGTKRWGVELHRIIDNGPADLAGLQAGDVVTEFDGHPIKTVNELSRRIRAAKPRTKVLVKVYRGNTEQLMELTPGHRG
jgi:membrane-associated protease RseP (regulator of RpoE activity)